MRGERGQVPVSSMAADAERHHYTPTEQLQHATNELGGKGAREFVVYQAQGSVVNG